MKKYIIISIVVIIILIAIYFAYIKLSNPIINTPEDLSVNITGIDSDKKQIDVLYKGIKNTLFVGGPILQAGNRSFELKTDSGIGIVSPIPYLNIAEAGANKKIYLNSLKTGEI